MQNRLYLFLYISLNNNYYYYLNKMKNLVLTLFLLFIPVPALAFRIHCSGEEMRVINAPSICVIYVTNGNLSGYYYKTVYSSVLVGPFDNKYAAKRHYIKHCVPPN